jgi:hypothetical protein
MKFEGYYLILSNNQYNDDYYNIDIINFNEKFILSYFNNNAYLLYPKNENQFEHQFYYFYDFVEINNKEIIFKTDHDFKHYYNIKDMYAIKNKHFFLIKKNPPQDLSLESIRKYFIKCGLEELTI